MDSSQLIFNSHEIKFIEKQHALTHGGNCFDLMQKAGRSLFEAVMENVPQAKKAWIFCGKGNNGGDGYIAAACFKEAGVAVQVFSAGDPHPGTEAEQAFNLYKKQGGTACYELPDENEDKPDVIVDALLGTGISSAPKPPLDEWILFINRTRVFTLSADVPSGVNADTGAVAGDCVKADATVCMLALKPGLLTCDAVDYVGSLMLEPLGVDTQGYFGKLGDLVEHSSPYPMMHCCLEDLSDDLPKRQPSANKGDNGKVLIIGGSKGFGGAAVMAAMGALRSGAGLVKVALDPINICALNAAVPEAMTVDFTDEDALARALVWADVVAVGPGLGTSEQAQALLSAASQADVALIYDADALNLLAAHEGPEVMRHRILTPHPGEAARLLGCTVSEINRDRFDACVRLQRKYGGVVLLKGAGSIVCDGKYLTVIDEGSAAMASGGMGDVLTGVTAAMVAQGLSLPSAMVTAAALHGRAGYLCGLEDGEAGTLATDLLVKIRRLVNGKEAL